MMSVIPAAQPGDHIVLKDGVYDTTPWLTANSKARLLVSLKGTSANPIVIRAQSIGGVEITGNAGFELRSSAYIIIMGFKFTHSQDNSAETDDIAIRCHDCSNIRFTRNLFALKTEYTGQSDLTSIDRYHSDWLGITSGSSNHNRIDHNTFMNKSTRGVFVFIFGSSGKMSQYNTVDHNYFYSQTFKNGNGGECMRVGNSALGLAAAFTTIESNLFEKCNGDREAITMKSSSNTIKWNTFRGNEGSLTLRHGNDNVVDGNYFLQGMNGVRVYGHDHKIINNYFEGDYGGTVRQTLVIGSGTVATDLSTSNSEHSQPQNILVAFNTLYKNKSHLVIGYGNSAFAPINITIVNNIIVGDTGTLVDVVEGVDLKWKNNILWGAAIVGDIPTSGFTKQDPMLLLDSSTGIYKLSATSPALDKVGSIDMFGIDKDIDGRTRTVLADIGSQEYRALAPTTTAVSGAALTPEKLGYLAF
jgi:poly(beta-D-mannuronate) lyase